MAKKWKLTAENKVFSNQEGPLANRVPKFDLELAYDGVSGQGIFNILGTKTNIKAYSLSEDVYRVDLKADSIGEATYQIDLKNYVIRFDSNMINDIRKRSSYFGWEVSAKESTSDRLILKANVDSDSNITTSNMTLEAGLEDGKFELYSRERLIESISYSGRLDLLNMKGVYSITEKIMDLGTVLDFHVGKHIKSLTQWKDNLGLHKMNFTALEDDEGVIRKDITEYLDGEKIFEYDQQVELIENQDIFDLKGSVKKQQFGDKLALFQKLQCHLQCFTKRDMKWNLFIDWQNENGLSFQLEDEADNYNTMSLNLNMLEIPHNFYHTQDGYGGGNVTIWGSEEVPDSPWKLSIISSRLTKPVPVPFQLYTSRTNGVHFWELKKNNTEMMRLTTNFYDSLYMIVPSSQYNGIELSLYKDSNEFGDDFVTAEVKYGNNSFDLKTDWNHTDDVLDYDAKLSVELADGQKGDFGHKGAIPQMMSTFLAKHVNVKSLVFWQF